MQVVCNTNELTVVKACELANSLLRRPDFYVGIAAHPNFDIDRGGKRALVTPTQVADILRTTTLAFSVKLFTPPWYLRWTKYLRTQAYTDPGIPDTLFLKSYWIRNEAPTAGYVAATILHECVHAADTAGEFGHGDNSPAGKENTAPYWIGSYANSLLTGQPMATLAFGEEA